MIADIGIYNCLEAQLRTLDLVSLNSFVDMVFELYERSAEQGPGGATTYATFTFDDAYAQLMMSCDTDTDSDAYHFKLTSLTTHPSSNVRFELNEYVPCEEFIEFMEYVIENSIHNTCG